MEQMIVKVGLASCGLAAGAEDVYLKLREYLGENPGAFRLAETACNGMCFEEPVVELCGLDLGKVTLGRVNPENILPLVQEYKSGKLPSSNIILAERHPAVRNELMANQKRIVLQNCGIIDPLSIGDYEERGGYAALRKALKLSPQAIIDEIQNSGLRGRGGAGFSTGLKWALCAASKSDKKYVICNADEGDPGAFMDRMILESYPYRVIEGMIIASIAVGATEGVLYIRAEYPLAVKRIRQALADLEAAGLLGNNIFGSGHSLSLRVFEGAGAFVCGEESALIASIEGRRGMPSFRPPFPAEKGLHGCPTLVNNAETYSMLSWIIRNGAEAFAALGTEHSKGTKVFSLAGKVARGGLIEVPMGITIREVVEQIGGGVADGRTFKAVQVGGPSGGCIPAALGDTPVDYEALKDVGAMMGSGGFVVLDDTDCMVEMARYFLSFTQSESCGKCTPCRVGTKRMLEILERLCNGKGKAGDIERLEQLARTVQAQSLCGLGKTAPNPVLTTIRYFREEFEAHIEGRCPAGKCTPMVRYVINDDCIGCAKCAKECPVDAIRGEPYAVFEIDETVCVRCDNCRQICPVNAVVVE